MKFYVDFDDCLCETARALTGIAERLFGKKVLYEEIRFFNLKDSFDLDYEEVEKEHPQREIATSCVQVLEEVLQRGQHQNAKVEGRMILHKAGEV